jgi:hypothetical protein
MASELREQAREHPALRDQITTRRRDIVNMSKGTMNANGLPRAGRLSGRLAKD